MSRVAQAEWATILWEWDEPLVLKAAGLIGASAHRHSATLLHKDPEFDMLLDAIKQERLPDKTTGKVR